MKQALLAALLLVCTVIQISPAYAADPALVSAGYKVGAVDYLIKPLVPEVVRVKVEVFAELFRQRKRIEQQARLLVEAERKESDLRLVELRLASERRYRGLAEAVPNIIWTAGPDGVVDYFNRRWFEYTGLSTEQAAGAWYGAVHPDDRGRCQSSWADALRSGRRYEVECRLLRADGSARWHLCRALPEPDSGGQITTWIGTLTDIEDQKQAEAVLAEFKGTLDAVLDAVLIFEATTHRLLYVNRGAEMLFGYPSEELLKMRPFELLAEHDETRVRETLAPLTEGSQTATTLETRCRRGDGTAIPIEISFQLIPIDGGHFVSIARNITDRKVAEAEREQLYDQALDAVHARDEFLSVASHELRTPLSSLQLQVGLLAKPPSRAASTPLSPEQLHDRLTAVARGVDRLSRLVSDLMDVSRINAGRLRLEVEEVDLAALARELVERFEADAAKAKCTVTLHAETPAVGRWDRLRLEQVLTNLLGNAWKFGAGHPVEVSVSAGAASTRLVVRDHGIGISPEDSERVFRRFERVSSDRAYPGLGLGLYIVRQIVEAHGGTIEVESRPGQGSEFIVTLPSELPEPKRPASDTSAVRDAQDGGAGHGEVRTGG